jgi:hypothetical protein
MGGGAVAVGRRVFADHACGGVSVGGFRPAPGGGCGHEKLDGMLVRGKFAHKGHCGGGAGGGMIPGGMLSRP